MAKAKGVIKIELVADKLPMVEEPVPGNLEKYRKMFGKFADIIWQDGYNTGLKHMDQMHTIIDNKQIKSNEKDSI